MINIAELNKQQTEYNNTSLTRVNSIYNDKLNEIGLELKAKFGLDDKPLTRPFSVEACDVWLLDKENNIIEHYTCSNYEQYLNTCKSIALNHLR